MAVKFHFLNVWCGDCTIIHFPERKREQSWEKIWERIMVIDINHAEDHDEYENFLEYYNTHFQWKSIFRYVCTHPHHDHIKWLHKVIDELEILNLRDLDHEFSPVEFHHDWHESDWKKYEELRDSISHRKTYTRETEPCEYRNEDKIKILSPSLDLIEKAHYKDDGTKREIVDIDLMSYALLIEVNSRKIVLGWDAKENGWNDIYENCADLIENVDVLKAPHHWRQSAFHEDAVKHMNPNHIVFSMSENWDSEHWAEDLYLRAIPDAKIYKTNMYWTMIMTVPFSKDEEIYFTN